MSKTFRSGNQLAEVVRIGFLDNSQRNPPWNIAQSD
jgi:hypothetical protein